MSEKRKPIRPPPGPWTCPICKRLKTKVRLKMLRWLDIESGEVRHEPVCGECGPRDADPLSMYGELCARQRTKKH